MYKYGMRPVYFSLFSGLIKPGIQTGCYLQLFHSKSAPNVFVLPRALLSSLRLEGLCLVNSDW